MRRRPTSTTKTIVFAAPLMVLAAVLMVFFVLRLAKSPEAEIQLGDDVFEVGQVSRLAAAIERNGPLLFQDLKGNELHIYVQHLGTDRKEGWLAFSAVPPGGSERCAITWTEKAGFQDPCTKAAYPPEGTGLTHYATEVKPNDKGALTLYVDLRKAVSN